MIDKKVLELMKENGGSFNRKLADLYECADSENSKKLELAFCELFARFEMMAGVKCAEK